MKLVTVQEMQQLEKAADETGHTYEAMMELAGRAVAELIQNSLDVRDKLILILVGPGNNGGDGLVAARYLAQAGAQVKIVLAKPRASDDPNMVRLKDQNVDWLLAQHDADGLALRETLQTADVLVDALLGTGVDRPINGILADILCAAREVTRTRRVPPPSPLIYLGSQKSAKAGTQDSSPPWIVAIDVPSGVNCDTGAVDPVTLSADTTITFAAAKLGQFRYPAAGVLGQLIVADIGIPSALCANIQREIATHRKVAERLPTRPRDAHKGTFGKAMIAAGSANYVGAAYLAAAAAGRIGAGLVTLAAPAALHTVLAQKLTEATHLLLPHDMGALTPGAIKVLSEHVDGYTSLLIGPGLGQAPETVNFVHQLFGIEGDKRARQIGFQPNAKPPSAPPSLPPLVIDADALNALSLVTEWWRHVPMQSILTPHPGEMGRLMGVDTAAVNEDRIVTAAEQAAVWGQVVVLKGAYTVVAAPDGRATVIPSSTPALATAGTGDVLAGSIAGLLAQGLAPYDAALCGAYLHGLAGIMLQDQVGDAGALAGDLLPLLPQAIRQVRDR
jgi:NAD(P)H-hydrate epimerase